MSEALQPIAESVLEILWQEDASAYALVREPDGTLSSGGLHEGMNSFARCVNGIASVGLNAIEFVTER